MPPSVPAPVMLKSFRPVRMMPLNASEPPAAMAMDWPATVGRRRSEFRLNAVAPMVWLAVMKAFALALLAHVAVVVTAVMPFATAVCVAKARPVVVPTTAQPVLPLSVLLSSRPLLSAGSVVKAMRGLLPVRPRVSGVPNSSLAEKTTVPSGGSLVSSRS